MSDASSVPTRRQARIALMKLAGEEFYDPDHLRDYSIEVLHRRALRRALQSPDVDAARRDADRLARLAKGSAWTP